MTGVGPRAATVAWGFEAIGTSWEVETAQPLDPDVRQSVRDVVERFDHAWSRFRADSTVTAMAREAGSWQLQGAGALLRLYDDLHVATDGAVTPLVGRSLEDLGYDARYSLQPNGRAVPPESWAQVRSDGSLVVDHETLGSGDLRHVGGVPIRVALEHPGDASRAVGVVEVADGWALCASAVNRRVWGEGLHHVVDGRTGRPTRDVVATWALVDGSCMVADGLATAHFFADPQTLLDLHPHHFVRIHADGRVLRSPDLPGELFT